MKITTNEGLTFEGSVEEYRKFIALGAELDGGKVSADTLEYDGVTYRKVCEKAAGETEEKAEADELQVGDFAEVIEGGNGFSRKGDVVSIAEKDSATVLYKIKHLNGKFAGWKAADGLRKIPVTYYEGNPYREVDRRAEKGELIKVISAELAFGQYEDGDVLTAEKLVGNNLFARNSAGKRAELRHKEYVVLEPIDPKETDPEEIAFQIGDKVRIIGGDSHFHRVGSIGEVIGFSEDTGNPSVKVNGVDQYVSYEGLEKVTESSAKGHTAVVTYADGTTQTLDDVKSVEITAETNTEGSAI